MKVVRTEPHEYGAGGENTGIEFDGNHWSWRYTPDSEKGYRRH